MATTKCARCRVKPATHVVAYRLGNGARFSEYVCVDDGMALFLEHKGSSLDPLRAIDERAPLTGFIVCAGRGFPLLDGDMEGVLVWRTQLEAQRFIDELPRKRARDTAYVQPLKEAS